MSRLVVGWIRALFLSRAELAIENLALRQQLAVLKRKRTRSSLRNVDRTFWVTLRCVYSKWSSLLGIVEPETVVRWHRAGFKALWRWKSRRRGRASCGREVRELIRRMAREHEVGSAARSCRAFETGISGVGEDGLTLHAKAGSEPGRNRAMEEFSSKSPRGDRGDGLVHGADGELPACAYFLRDPSLPEITDTSGAKRGRFTKPWRETGR